MRQIFWTDEAVGNLEAIVTYISAFNPAAATRLAQRLIAVADSLAEFSERGRDAGDGRREMTIVWPYVLRYRVEGERVLILRYSTRSATAGKLKYRPEAAQSSAGFDWSWM